jgi:hypothetical protein
MAKTSSTARKSWEPPSLITREEIIAASNDILGRPDIPIKTREDLFRIQALEMDWDIGAVIYEPADPSKIPVGADGKKIGIFLLHGGSGDFRQMEKLAQLLVGKFGVKVVSGTFPGRFYLLDKSRDWPGDSVNPDGTVRTPLWKEGETITPDQYEVVSDTSMRERYGTRMLARAKPGTTFYYRMAAWPVAMEEGMKATMVRNFPEDEYSIYVQGHSTGGPMVSMLSQRVPNIQGVLAAENSPFGYVDEKKHEWSGHLGKIGNYERVSKKPKKRTDPFNDLYIRSWRDRARYKGPEALGQEGPNALMRLPMLMEEVFEDWQRQKARPQFKAEYLITHNIEGSLKEAAEVTAKRLKLGPEDTRKLVARYLGYPRELKGPGVKPVPPFLFGLAQNSRDHHIDSYKEVVLPMFAAMDPAPKVRVVQFGAGVHHIWAPEQDLPMGIAPAVVKSWIDAIVGGFFVVGPTSKK